jgi:hypothetical protein
MGTVSEKTVVTRRQAQAPAVMPDATGTDPWIPPGFEPPPPVPDWEDLIASGAATPALILGAERRLRRGR